MAITAATASVDRIVRGDSGKTLFQSGKSATSSSSSWKQGDLLYFDTSNHIINVVSATGNAATILGIADNAVTSGKLVGPYDGLTAVDAAQVTPDFVGPKYGVVASMILKTSDAFNIGSKVYLTNGGTSQTVTVTDPSDGNYIGIFVGPAAVASAAAGQQGYILIGSRYPQATATGLNF